MSGQETAVNVIFVYSDRLQFATGSAESNSNVSIEEPVPFESNNLRLDVFERIVANQIKKGALAILFGPRYAVRYALQDAPTTRKNVQALKFACEEHIPLSAEQIETDIVDSSRLGVAIDSGLLNGLLEICERHQVEVAHTGFVDLEVMQWLVNSGKLNDAGTLILGSDRGVSVIGISDGKPDSWDWFPGFAGQESPEADADPGVLFKYRLLILDSNAPYFLTDVTPEVIEHFTPDERQFVDTGVSREKMAARNAFTVASGRVKPFISIQSETHRPKSYLNSALSMLVVSVAVLLVSLAAYFWVAGSQFANRVDEIEAELQTLYKDSVPDGPKTSLISRTLKARLADMEQDLSARELTQSTDAIRQNLHWLLSGVPDDIEFELQSIGIRPRSVALAGTVKSIDDLIAFKSRLEVAGFVIAGSDLRKQFSLSLIPSRVSEDLK